ncbi:MAG: CoA-binding protein, partial [Kiritimatiellae bacterium]|nr:CoA-binding protein [Kiritimatiellia bacterium]
MLTRGEVVAVLGSSPNPKTYAYKVQRALAVKGHPPVPINPYFEQMDGWVCYPTLQSCPKKIDTTTVYVKPKLLADLLEDIQ